MQLKSLQTRIVLAITGTVFLLMALVVMLFGMETKRELSQSFESNALNLLYATRNQVESHYNSIQYYQESMLKRRKLELKNNIDIAFSVIDTAYRYHQLAGLDEARAQQMTLRRIMDIRYNDGVGYFWVNDTSRPIPKIMMHPISPELVGKSSDGPLYRCLTDEAGNPIPGNMFSAFLNTCLEHGEGYLNYFWHKPTAAGLTEVQPKLGYVKLFKPWNWIIGTGVYVDDINRDIKQRTEAVIKDLNQLLHKQTIGDSGYFFIFNEADELLVHPLYSAAESANLINPETGHHILEDLKEAEKTAGHSLVYPWDKPDDKGHFVHRKISYVTRFQPLGWYICSSIYLDDYEKKIDMLSRQTSLLGGFFILVSLIVAFLIARSITHPLKNLVSTITVTDEDGLPTRAVVGGSLIEFRVLADTINGMVSSIKKSRGKLKESESFNKLLFKDSRIPLLVLDAETLRFIDCNQAAAEVYGFGCIEQTLGKTPVEVSAKTQYDGEDSLVAAGKMLARVRQVKSVIFEWRHQRENGEIWDAEVHLAQFHYQGRDLFQLSLQDITERKKAQEELNHVRKMEAVGQLAGGIAHDFNNMLGGIMGAAELLRNPKRGLDEKGRKLTDLILRASSQAANLTTKLMAFGRKGRVTSQVADINRIVSDSVAILQKTIDRKIVISMFPAGTAAPVLADVTGLQNAFINLGINAAHAMPDGGALSFDQRIVDLGPADCDGSPFKIRPGRYVEIEVGDSGCGIEPENLEHIFEPFFTTRKQGQGSGLGLAAVYGTVREHQGAIQVFSRVGEGTVFLIHLPLCDGHVGEDATANTQEAVPYIGRGRILLVDDEDIILNVGRDLLEELGYEVVTAADGFAAVNIFRGNQGNQGNQEKIDLVITDMLMPKMNGRELFYQLRQIDPDCPVILASGYTDNAGLDEMKRDGLRGFLPKPFNSEDLKRLLGEVMARPVYPE